MQLDTRLRSVVDEIHDSNCTIDVGTDHGKVILTALSEGRCVRGIASDISRDSLAKARDSGARLNIPLDTRLGDGLSVLSADDNIDTAVIAGMGGREIVKILSNSPIVVPRLILVPHRDARLVRRYLVDNGYMLERDYIVQEGTFYYPIIVARVGRGELTIEEEYYGARDMANSAYRAYISYRLGVLENIIVHADREELSVARALVREIERYED